MLAEQLDLSLEDPGSHGDILPSNLVKVKWFCLQVRRRGWRRQRWTYGAGRCESERASRRASRKHLDSQAFAFPGTVRAERTRPAESPANRFATSSECGASLKGIWGVG
jgi:hypothetical protein